MKHIPDSLPFPKAKKQGWNAGWGVLVLGMLKAIVEMLTKQDALYLLMKATQVSLLGDRLLTSKGNRIRRG